MVTRVREYDNEGRQPRVREQAMKSPKLREFGVGMLFLLPLVVGLTLLFIRLGWRSGWATSFAAGVAVYVSSVASRWIVRGKPKWL